MLFNPNWRPKPTGELTALDRLIAWLETKPADQSYRYTDPTDCLLAQYIKAQGTRGAFAGHVRTTFRDASLVWPRRNDLPPGFYDVALHGGTFGGALKLAKGIASQISTSRSD